LGREGAESGRELLMERMDHEHYSPSLSKREGVGGEFYDCFPATGILDFLSPGAAIRV
jgi:hypothetical protein